MTTTHPTPADVLAALVTAEQAVAALTVENRQLATRQARLRASLRDVTAQYHYMVCQKPGFSACANPTCRAVRAALDTEATPTTPRPGGAAGEEGGR